ncbi:MAG TPA: outer membrane beta-barrel protein [Balneolaceae bacterium]
MKKLSLLFIHFIFVATVYGQATEYSIHLNSGLFSFGGESATGSSFIIASDVGTINNYTNNPYGTNKALSYGLALQIQRITSGQSVLGLQLGYEMLRSHVQINSISTNHPDSPFPASGQTTLKHDFLNVYPNFGYRFRLQNMPIDLTVGPEFGFNLSSRETGKATFNDGSLIKTNTERSDPGTDIRLRSSLTIYYNDWGISAGYSYGLNNYTSGLAGANSENFSRFIRFGLTYKIK